MTLPDPARSTSNFGALLAIALLVLQCGDIVLPLDPSDAGPLETDSTDEPTPDRYCTADIGTTFYVRTDGGTAAQCTGTADAPYPGSGEGMACAFAHPAYALPNDGPSKLHAGDRLIIGSGVYSISPPDIDPATAPECDSVAGCMPGNIPSGIDADRPTCIVGAGWADGCTDPPVLTGGNRAPHLLALEDARFVTLGCLELTDGADCAVDHPDPKYNCDALESDYFPIAMNGISAAGSSDVVLKDLDIHGLSQFGIFGSELSDWSMERLRLTANGGDGIRIVHPAVVAEPCTELGVLLREASDRCRGLDVPQLECDALAEAGVRATVLMDVEEIVFIQESVSRCPSIPLDDATCETLNRATMECEAQTAEAVGATSSSGEMRLINVVSELNGCAENRSRAVESCFSSAASSGLFVSRSAADWRIEESRFDRNTRDGVHIELHDSSRSVEIRRTLFQENARTQLTSIGNATVVNSVIAGACGYFTDRPEGLNVTDCMDGGIALRLVTESGASAVMVNDTVWGYGDILMTGVSSELEESSVSLSVTAMNTIFSGAERKGISPQLFTPEASVTDVRWINNLFYTVVGDNEAGLCDSGAILGNLCANPMFISADPSASRALDFTLNAESPAVDWGLPVGTVGLVPAVDLLGTPRPVGQGVDLGAFERPAE